MSWNARFLLMFGGGWAGVGLLGTIVLLLTSRPPWDDWILDRRGVRAEAEAIEVRTTMTSVNDEDLFDLVLRFRDGAGRAHTAVLGTIDEGRITAARQHRTLIIEYDPEDPSRARLQGETASLHGSMLLLPAGFAITGAPLFLLGMVGLVRARRLYRRGQAAQAVVTMVAETHSSENDERVKEMRYTFQTARGPALGTWKTASPLPVGATLWVVHDPSAPENNVPSQS